MMHWKAEKRRDLWPILSTVVSGRRTVWKLARALFEILPWDLEDWKLVNALMSECETLRIEGKRESFRSAQQELI